MLACFFSRFYVYGFFKRLTPVHPAAVWARFSFWFYSFFFFFCEIQNYAGGHVFFFLRTQISTDLLTIKQHGNYRVIIVHSRTPSPRRGVNRNYTPPRMHNTILIHYNAYSKIKIKKKSKNVAYEIKYAVITVFHWTWEKIFKFVLVKKKLFAATSTTSTKIKFFGIFIQNT